MTNMVTRCPQCSTSFRITPTQIQKARGAVRCGSCLHIFKAQDHLVQNVTGILKAKVATKTKAKETQEKPPKTPVPQQETLDIPSAQEPPKKAKSPSHVEEKQSLPANEALVSELEDQPKPTPAPKEKESTPDSSKEEPGIGLNFDQMQIDAESQLDDELLISDDMDKPGSSNTEDEVDHFYIKPTEPASSLFEGKEDELLDEFTDPSDESWTEDILESTQEQEPLDEKQEPLDEKEKAPAQNTTLAERLASHNTTNTQVFSPSTTTQEAQSTHAIPKAQPSVISTPKSNPLSFHLQAESDENEEVPYNEHISAFNSDRAAMLMNIDPEPLEIISPDDASRHKKMLWGGLSALAVLLLLVQIAYFQFDNLSRVKPYRSYYQSLCSVFGCNLPILVDTRKIRAYNLVVRNHPEIANTLIVDAIILNNALFGQPYPSLALEFSDINNNPVASRHFSPDEYLHGELRGSEVMRQNQPVHISLELVDPGTNAVNYRIFTP